MNTDSLTKSPKTFSEQVEILKQRGLLIHDRERAAEILSRVNYYRLSAYWLTYKNNDEFTSRVSFEDIYRIYEFDKNFRNLVTNHLETIEVAFRTQIAYTIAHTYGPLGYMEPSNFCNATYHHGMMNEIEKEIGRSRELFINHHRTKYKGSFPVWVVVEVMSFGTLSKMYSNLKPEVGAEVADAYYGVSYHHIRNWLHAISVFRNICAHYGRTYNRKMALTPSLMRRDKKNGVENDSVFAVLLILGRLLNDRSQWNSFMTELSALIEECEIVDLSLVGFPKEWESVLRKL